MINENAYLFLSDGSIGDLEKSKGAMILIHYPIYIEAYKKEIERLEKSKEPLNLEFEGLKKGLEDLSSLPLAQRIFSARKIKEERQDYVLKIQENAKKLADIDSLIAEYTLYIYEAGQEINAFVYTLNNINVKPEDVVAAYHEIKARLEAPVEEKKPVEVVAEPEAIEPVKPAKTVKTTGTKEARLSPREKFERRLAKTKEMQEQSQRQQ